MIVADELHILETPLLEKATTQFGYVELHPIEKQFLRALALLRPSQMAVSECWVVSQSPNSSRRTRYCSVASAKPGATPVSVMDEFVIFVGRTPMIEDTTSSIAPRMAPPIWTPISIRSQKDGGEFELFADTMPHQTMQKTIRTKPTMEKHFRQNPR